MGLMRPSDAYMLHAYSAKLHFLWDWDCIAPSKGLSFLVKMLLSDIFIFYEFEMKDMKKWTKKMNIC